MDVSTSGRHNIGSCVYKRSLSAHQSGGLHRAPQGVPDLKAVVWQLSRTLRATPPFVPCCFPLWLGLFLFFSLVLSSLKDPERLSERLSEGTQTDTQVGTKKAFGELQKAATTRLSRRSPDPEHTPLAGYKAFLELVRDAGEQHGFEVATYGQSSSSTT